MMQAVPYTPPQNGRGREDVIPAPSRQCVECMKPFASPQPAQLFCCRAHGKAFQKRWEVRGRLLAQLETAVMVTRQGRTGDKDAGVKAARAANRLKRQWIAEDRAITADRPAGRMPMDQYIRRLMRHHDLP